MADLIDQLSAEPSGLAVQMIGGRRHLIHDRSRMQSYLGFAELEEAELNGGRFVNFERTMQAHRVSFRAFGSERFQEIVNWMALCVPCKWSYHQDWGTAILSFETVPAAVHFKLAHFDELDFRV